MLNDRQAFLDYITANLDDDTPRLVYADWLQEHGEDERAEFIRVQCRLAAMDENNPDREALVHRQNALLTATHDGLNNYQRWLAEDFPHMPLQDIELVGPQYERGFPTKIYVDIDNAMPVYSQWSALGECAFLKKLEVEDVFGFLGEIRENYDTGPALEEVEYNLDSDDDNIYPFTRDGEDIAIDIGVLADMISRDLAAIAPLPGIKQLKALSIALPNAQTEEGQAQSLHALLSANTVQSLERFSFSGGAEEFHSNAFPDAPHLSKLHTLELHVDMDMEDLSHLISRPLLKHIHTLYLPDAYQFSDYTTIDSDAAKTLFSLPALKELSLHFTDLLTSSVQDLVSASPPGLQRLEVRGHSEEDGFNRRCNALLKAPWVQKLKSLTLGDGEVDVVVAKPLLVDPKFKDIQQLAFQVRDDGTQAASLVKKMLKEHNSQTQRG